MKTRDRGQDAGSGTVRDRGQDNVERSETHPVPGSPHSQLAIFEIYRTIQGESTFAGLPCTMVRLAGCNLACEYCDTSYARSGGTSMTVVEIVEKVRELGSTLVEVTGGEPLTQEGTPALLQSLLDTGARVLLETNGSCSIERVPEGVITIYDIKCPGSGEADRNRWENIERLRENDQVKFVLCDRADYDWARERIAEYRLDRFEILLSPAAGLLEPCLLADWMKEDPISARLNIQIHRVLWPEGEPR